MSTLTSVSVTTISCQQVIKKHYPNAKIYGNIKELKGKEVGRVDLVSGGFPCQPFSSAGKRKGKEDDRWLWPEMFRVVKETKPRWVVGENVANFVGMALDETIADLESIGYEVQPFVIPACAVNAPHRRDRVWLVAHTDSYRQSGFTINENAESRKLVKNVSNSNGQNVQGSFFKKKSNRLKARTIPIPKLWETRKSLLPQTVLCRTDDGIPNRVVRTKALGNAIVPQVAAQIFKAIKQIDAPSHDPRKETKA